MEETKHMKILLSCFMIISIIGMGFTGYRVTEVKHKQVIAYIDDQDRVANENYTMEGPANLIKILENRVDIKLSSYILMAGDKKVGTLKSFGQIEEILEGLKEEYSATSDESIDVKTVEILEDLDILKEEVYLDDIDSIEEVMEYIKTGGEKLDTHTIEVGESFSTISKIYNISIEDLEFLNPDKVGRELEIGDNVTIRTVKPLITVATTQEVETIKNINFEVETIEDSEMYDTKSEVRVDGEIGQEKIITKEIKHNGEVIEKEILTKEIIKEPVNKVIVKGTKKMPKTAATGSFLMPTRGRLSSPFGSRWGRMHRGIDIAKSQGSDIKASDGGTVTFSGVLGTYGNLIEIDHGNGYKTRYAHCSRLLLGVGQKVYKGQVIAKVGSTGRSTGPHLHFEVIKNGTHQNPLNYVN